MLNKPERALGRNRHATRKRLDSRPEFTIKNVNSEESLWVWKICTKRVMDLNMMDDNDQKKEVAKTFFEKLNAMGMPEYFNWAEEIFDGMHLKERADKTALIWSDINTKEKKTYTYREFAAKGNQCLNKIRSTGADKGDNMYMMVSIVPETWFASYACIKGGLVAVPTATTMTLREMEFRFETYPPNCILADEAYTDIIDEAIKLTNSSPKIKLVRGSKPGWISYSELDSESPEAKPAPDQVKRHAVLLFHLRNHRSAQKGWPYCRILSAGAPVHLGDDRNPHRRHPSQPWRARLGQVGPGVPFSRPSTSEQPRRASTSRYWTA